MEFVSLVINTMESILEQVFNMAENDLLQEWGIRTVENIADKTMQNMLNT